MRRVGLAACCLTACLLLGWFLDATGVGEFSGGRVTQWLFRAADIAWVLFALALVVTLLRPGVGAWIALAGCALWTPLIVYGLARAAGVDGPPFKTRGGWSPNLILSALTLPATIYLSRSWAGSRFSAQR